MLEKICTQHNKGPIKHRSKSEKDDFINMYMWGRPDSNRGSPGGSSDQVIRDLEPGAVAFSPF